MPPRKTKTPVPEAAPSVVDTNTPVNPAELFATKGEMSQMQENLGLISAQLAQLTQMMTAGGKLSAAQFAAGPGFAGGVPLHGMPAPYPSQFGMPRTEASAVAPIETDDGNTFYVRIKPYDPKRKQLRGRQYFDELKRCLNGGTGQPGDIPEWVAVDYATACSLSQYKQIPEDPLSPLVLDIVTPEQRLQIDTAEAQARMATLGLAGMAPHAVLNTMQRPGMVAPHVGEGRPHMAAVPSAPQGPTTLPQPSLMAGAAEYQNAVAALNATQYAPASTTAPMAAVPFVPDPARAGRAAALEGVQRSIPAAPAVNKKRAYAPRHPEASQPVIDASTLPDVAPGAPPPPVSDRGVSEDLTGEAQASHETAEAIRTATPLMSGSRGGVAR